MEYMDQGSLSSYAKQNKGTLSWQASLSLALDVARGMQFLHNTSPPIVHRDLKVPLKEKMKWEMDTSGRLKLRAFYFIFILNLY